MASHIDTESAEVNPSEITLLITRPAPAAARFAQEAERALGPFAETLLSPVLRIVPVGPVPPLPAQAEIAFTSENAVRVAAPALRDVRRPVWCVGTRTGAAARAEGLIPRIAQGTAEQLAEDVIAAAPEGPVLHLAGAHQAGNLVERLVAAGLRAERVAIYDQRPVPLTDVACKALRAPGPLLLPLFSPRSAALVADAVTGAHAAAPIHVVALSSAVASAWSAAPPSTTRSITTASAPDTRAMIEAMRYIVGTISGA
ncbi:MAG: uroporphyrinogen-III synthase [Pseudomonadota bacterium]